jgi:molybdopterin molybdotransferase
MLAVEEALEIVLGRCRPRPPQDTPLSAEALGRVLEEPVSSDLDMPPFDKALMDGYAVRAADVPDGRAVLPIAAEVMAGQTAPPLPPGQAIRIMTGAPIPAGADAVVRVEDTAVLDDGRVRFETKPPKPGQSILRRAAEMAAGDVVLRPCTVLTPQALGLLASVGRMSAKIIPRPTLAVLATGDELVEAPQQPGPGQLRNSNGPMLLAQAARAGAAATYLGIARDDRAHLRSLIEQGLKSDALVLAGGVSMGQRDLVPGILAELRVEAHAHHIAMKPGKPFFFGTVGSGQWAVGSKNRSSLPTAHCPSPTLVFGLPGNPVSAFCCFELFVRPALRKLAGILGPGPDWRWAKLTGAFTHASDRPTYHPAQVSTVGEVTYAMPVEWFGSPDLRALAKADALVRLPAGTHSFPAGTRVAVLSLDSWDSRDTTPRLLDKGMDADHVDR